jgi:hypothetical protein
MAEGATVEFWGCYVGSTEQTGKAISSAFNADFKALEDELRTTHDTFLRPADKGEAGKAVAGQKGRFVAARSTKEIDDRVAKGNKQLGESFNAWLVTQAKMLEAEGDLPPQPDDAARVAEMRKVFDRSGGNVKRLEIHSTTGSATKSDKKVWAEKWKTIKK